MFRVPWLLQREFWIYFSNIWISERYRIWSKLRIKTIAPVSRHTYLTDRVTSVVYILHHTRPLTYTSNHITGNKKYCPSQRLVLKELQLDVPKNFCVNDDNDALRFDENDVDTMNVPDMNCPNENHELLCQF